jgi:hypothetical protein
MQPDALSPVGSSGSSAKVEGERIKAKVFISGWNGFAINSKDVGQ